MRNVDTKNYEGIVLNKKKWDNLVVKGKAISERDRATMWDWGDLAMEVDPAKQIGFNGRRTETGKFEQGPLYKWAQEVGYEHSLEHLRLQRWVASKWPRDKRIESVPWMVHRILCARDDRFEVIHPGLTIAQARITTGQRHFHSESYKATFEDAIRYLDQSASFERSALRVLEKMEIDDDKGSVVEERLLRVGDELDKIADLI